MNPEQATPIRSILLVLMSAVALACSDTIGKYLVVNGISPLFVTWGRFVVHASIVFVLLRGWKRHAILRCASPLMHIVRGVLLVISSILFMYAARTISLAELTSIVFFWPMLTTALAGPLLGEHVGWRRWLAVAAGFAGVLIVVKPGFESLSAEHLMALGSMLFYCLFIIMTRKMGGSETPESLLFYAGAVSVVALVPLNPLAGVLPTQPLEWLLVLLLGFIAALAHYCMIAAYRHARASALAPYTYAQIVCNFVLGYLVFAHMPDLWTFLGSAIIVGSGLYILQRERKLRLKPPLAGESDVAPFSKKDFD